MSPPPSPCNKYGIYCFQHKQTLDWKSRQQWSPSRYSAMEWRQGSLKDLSSTSHNIGDHKFHQTILKHNIHETSSLFHNKSQHRCPQTIHQTINMNDCDFPTSARCVQWWKRQSKREQPWSLEDKPVQWENFTTSESS